MRLCQRLRHQLILPLLLIAPAAFASVQFSYQSAEMPFVQGYVAGYPDENIISEPPFPAFRVNLTGDLHNQRLDVASGDVSLGWDNFSSSYALGELAADNSFIHVDSSGVPDSWYLALELLLQTPGDANNPPSRDYWRVVSTYGTNTCNCDSLWYEYDIYTERPYNTWVLATYLSREYIGGSAPGNWQWSQASVAEPSPLWLLAGSLVLLVALRQKSKSLTWLHRALLPTVLSILSPGLLLLAPAASAGVLLNYQSQELAFIEGYLNGSPDETVGSREPPFPIFTLAAEGSAQGDLVTFTSGQVTQIWPPSVYDLGNFTATDSYLRFNPDGSIAAWHFDLQLLVQTDGGDWGPSRDFWHIQSSYGDNSCNCDTLWYEYDLYMQRQESWIYIGNLGFENQSANSPANWNSHPVALSEPLSGWLLFIGLVGLTIKRRAPRQPNVRK